MPAWLQEVAASLEETPAWLAEEVPGVEPVAATPVDDWLADVGLDAETAAVPSWLLEPVAAEEAPAERPAPPPAEVPAAEVPAAAAMPEPTPPLPPAVLSALASAAIPEGPAYEVFRRRLAADAGDHATRLALARRLLLDNNGPASLGHYEALAFAEAMLSDVERDLRALVQRQPDLPQARRVLGDVFMREGRLQEALDTYRAALEQL